MKTALVTGGTGFLGRALLLRLQELGFAVSFIGRNELIGKELTSAGCEFLKLDLTDRNAVIQACKDKEYVFHCAALSAPWGRRQNFFESNVVGTRNVVDASVMHGACRRFVHVSTASVYFSFQGKINLPESDVLPEPVNDYIRSKRLAENIVLAASREGLPSTIIRPRGIFGPRDKTIFPRFIKANARFGIPLINDHVVLDITYIDNVVEALINCLSAGNKSSGSIYNITNGEPRRLIDLLVELFDRLDIPLRFRRMNWKNAYILASVMEAVATASPVPFEPIFTRYTMGLLSFSQTLNIDSARTELGYRPGISLHDGLERFVRHWRAASLPVPL